MKYSIYFRKSNDNDSLIAYSKEQMKKEVASLLSEDFEVEKVCKIVKGEYIPIDIKSFC